METKTLHELKDLDHLTENGQRLCQRCETVPTVTPLCESCNREVLVEAYIMTLETKDDDETLDAYATRKVTEGLLSIEQLAEMSSDTRTQLSAQGIGAYQQGYMKRWAQFVLYGHEKKYYRLRQENEELRAEMRAIQKIIIELSRHLQERQH